MQAAETPEFELGESSIDEIRRDPDGYRERISARYDAEAAEWVEREMLRRIDLHRQRRKSLRRRLMGKISPHDTAA
jgi:hypothetical protein